MADERIAPDQVAKAAAEGVAIALAARNFSDDVEARGPILVGYFPDALFEVSFARDEVTGQFAVQNIQPRQFNG
ncbi:hypothetical protein JNUCC64_01855 [Streptomyces sp. JNUCC 64]